MQIDVFGGVSVGKLIVMAAALLSLFIDQSFGAMYGAIQNDVGGTLGASADELPWATIGYNTFYWVVIILTPWLIDRFGRRIVFGAGHLAFGLVDDHLAGAAWFDGFVFARCLEGLAQGTFFVCSVMTMLTLFPPKLRGLAYSVFGVTSLSGAASGAFIGGWFLDHAFWRYAMLAYALAGDVHRYRHLEVARGARCVKEKPVSTFRIAFVFVAFLSYQYIAAFGERRDWLASPDIVAALLLALVGFGLFIWRELCEDRCGFIQLRLFNIRNLPSRVCSPSASAFRYSAPTSSSNTRK